MLYYEDLTIGQKTRTGEYEVTRDEIVDFASKYDPQPFHLDDEAAAATHFGRLAASGWHTCAMTMHLMTRRWETTGRASLGSPGIDEIRFLRPVHPGDRLRVEMEVISKRRSKSRPEMALVRTNIVTSNQNDEAVLTMIATDMIAVRHPES